MYYNSNYFASNYFASNFFGRSDVVITPIPGGFIAFIGL